MVTFGIDTRPLFFARGGIASYVKGLVLGLFRVASDNRYVLLCPKKYTGQGGALDVPESAWHLIRLPLRNHALNAVWENILLPLAVRRARVDLVHFPRFAVPYFRAGRTVVTVHDLAFRRCPGMLTEKARCYFEAVTSKAVHRADAVIAVSEHTRQDLVDIYRVPLDRVHVVYNGVEPRFCPGEMDVARDRIGRACGLEGSYILFVGTLEPRKNLVGLLRAYALLRKSGAVDLPLVIAGGKGWLYEGIFQTVGVLGLRPYVRFLDYVPDADLPDLYRGARVFVYPSFYEGFGLPVLEAMACGTPVITSNVSALPEVAGDAALLVDPNEPEAIAGALGRILDDEGLAHDLRQRGIRQAAHFSWDRAAKETLSVYRTCIG